MKFNTIILLLSLSLMRISAVPKKQPAQVQDDVDELREVFYSNLCRLTSGLSKFISRNIQYMENKMPSGSRLNVPRLLLTHRLNLNEEQRLGSYVTQLQSFMPLIKTAISVENSLEGHQFLYNLTLVQYKVMNIKATLRHFTKLLNLPVIKKARGKTVAASGSTSNRLESFQMLRNLKLTLVLMNYELKVSSIKFTKSYK